MEHNKITISLKGLREIIRRFESKPHGTDNPQTREEIHFTNGLILEVVA